MKKRMISLVLTVAMLFSLCSLWSVDAQAYSPAKPVPELTGVTPLDIANIALSQLGYEESNGTVYGKWWNSYGVFGSGYTNLDWCAMFACWCSNQAGLGDGNAYDQYGAGAQALAQWYKNNAVYDNQFVTDPQCGDLLFFGNTTSKVCHVAVVIGYDSATRRITFVGGNQKPKNADKNVPASVTVDYVQWQRGAKREAKPQYVIGYGRPNYGKTSCNHGYTEWKKANLDGMCAQFRSCTLCGYDEVQCPGLGHNYAVTETVMSDCLTSGYTISTCTDCGKVKKEIINNAGHSIEWTVVKAATYSEPGQREGTCTVCGEFMQETIPMLELPFRDVAAGSWYEPAVRYVYDNDLMNGVSQTEFAPEATTNRAMLVTVLWRLEGSPAMGTTTHSFHDLSRDWYKEAVNWAYQKGIVTGRSQTVFAPEDPVTRQESATMLYRYCQMKGYDVSGGADLSSFPDANEVRSYARQPMMWAVETGLINGVSQGNGRTELEPASNTTRAQMATILMRLCENILK